MFHHRIWYRTDRPWYAPTRSTDIIFVSFVFSNLHFSLQELLTITKIWILSSQRPKRSISKGYFIKNLQCQTVTNLLNFLVYEPWSRYDVELS